MANWSCFLPPVTQVADGAAVVSVAGNLCGRMGNWKASPAEEQSYARLLKDPPSALSKGITYNGKKFNVARVLEDTIMAQLGKEGLVIQKSINVLVAAHFVDGQLMNSVSSRVAQVVNHLTANGA
jgi:hypothetical protein